MTAEDFAQLSDEIAWLERLALSLVRDRDEASDLAQETWLAALREDGGIQGSRRAWMVATLRRMWAGTLRGRKRRLAREQRHHSSRETQTPSVAELTMRTELHEHLLRIVRSLPEHYRAPLLLRYFEGLPPRQIAERLDVPVRSVGTRLHRALAMVRAELDRREPGGRDAWKAALLVGHGGVGVAGAPTGRGGATAAHGSASVSSAASPALWQLAAALLLVMLGVWSWMHWPSTPIAVGPGLVASEIGERVAATERVRSAEPSRIAADRRPAGAEPSEPVGAAIAVRGQVIDWQGEPLAGARVYRRENRGIVFRESAEAELVQGVPVDCGSTDADGRFDVDVDHRSWLYAEAPGQILAIAASVRIDDVADPRILVMAPARELSVRVCTPTGMPVANADVRVELGEGIEGRFPVRMRHARRSRWRGRSNDAGGIVLTIPDVRECWLVVACEGYCETRIAAADVGASLTLEPMATVLTGTVRDASGQPLADAWVACGDRAVAAAADGSFRFFDDAPVGDALFAAAPGWAVSRFAVTRSRDLDLVLTRRAVRIVGRIVDAAGVAVAGVEVSLHEPTAAATGSYVFSLERISAARRQVWHRSTSDEDGGFEVGGLASGSHRLRVYDPATGAVVITAPVLTELSTDIRLPAATGFCSVRGRVVRPNGDPVAGASVAVQCHRFRIPAVRASARGDTAFFGEGPQATTDANGAFGLDEVPRAHCWLRISVPGDPWVARVPLSESSARGGEIVLARAVEFFVTQDRAAGPLSLRVLDERGNAVDMRRIDARGSRAMPTFRLTGDHSPVLHIPETAAVVEVHRGEEPPICIPISPTVGERLQVRL